MDDYIHTYVYTCVFSSHFKMPNKGKMLAIFSWNLKLSFIALPTNLLSWSTLPIYLLFLIKLWEWSKLSVHFPKKKCHLTKLPFDNVFDKVILSTFKVVSESYNTAPVMLINIPIRIIKHSFIKNRKLMTNISKAEKYWRNTFIHFRRSLVWERRKIQIKSNYFLLLKKAVKMIEEESMLVKVKKKKIHPCNEQQISIFSLEVNGSTLLKNKVPLLGDAWFITN